MCLSLICVGLVIGFGLVVISIYGAEFEICTEILWRCRETKRMVMFDIRSLNGFNVRNKGIQTDAAVQRC